MKQEDIAQILECLEKTPRLLAGLLSHIPAGVLKERRIRNSWCIHEHACHVASGDRIGFIDRLKQFRDEENPVFVPLSGESFPPDHLMKMSPAAALDGFAGDRAESVELARSLEPSLWTKEGRHPEYITFTPYIMLRHRLLHDHFHMYRIEELWLTKDRGLEKK